MLFYGAFAIPAAHLLKTNYCSIYSAEGWGFLDPVFAKGYFLYDSVIVLIGIIVSLILYSSIVFVGHLRDKVEDNKYYRMGYKIMIPTLFILLLISKWTGYTQLQPIYCIYLTLVAFICELYATINSHILKRIKMNH